MPSNGVPRNLNPQKCTFRHAELPVIVISSDGILIANPNMVCSEQTNLTKPFVVPEMGERRVRKVLDYMPGVYLLRCREFSQGGGNRIFKNII